MWKGRFLLFHKELFPALLLSSLNSILSYSFKPHFPLTISLTGPFLFVAVICCSYFLRPPSCCHSRLHYYSFLNFFFSLFAASIPLLHLLLFYFSIFPFSLFNFFTVSFFLFQGAGGGTVVTVSVAEPDVDSDGSVYDVAEISQVIILYSHPSISLSLTLSLYL